MIWGIVSLILLIIVIGLVIWLLVRSTTTTKSNLNQACNNTSDCNSGLVCVNTLGVTGTNRTGVCKVAFGGVCVATSDCSAGQSCINGVCTMNLGTNGQVCPCAVGFTCVGNVCRAIVGQPCMNNSDCSTGVCLNNVCMPAGMTGMTGCFTSDFTRDTNSRCTDSSNSRRHHNTSTNTNTNSNNSSNSRRHNSSFTSDSTNRSRSRSPCSRFSTDSRSSRSRSTSDSSSNSSSDEFYTCSKSDCSKSKYSINKNLHCDKRESSSDLISASQDILASSDTKTDFNTDFNTDSNCNRYLKRGVYVTNQQNQDRTLFTGIDKAIIDIVQQGTSTGNFFLLLADGSMVSTIGIANTMISTNKKMIRIVRFGSEVIGLDKNGKLYSKASTSTANYWIWEHLSGFPRNVVFINSTNDFQFLEVLTCENKVFIFKFGADWRNGVATSKSKQKTLRFYGQDLNRFIDIDEDTDVGKTNDGVKYKHVRAAGFYNRPNAQSQGELVQVMTNDSFTHVKIIGSSAYFLFSQDC